MIGMVESIFTALGKGFEVWDYYNRTDYARKLRSIRTKIAEEESKPIYQHENGGDVRDQSKLDKLDLELKILVESFINDKGEVHGDKDKG